MKRFIIGGIFAVIVVAAIVFLVVSPQRRPVNNKPIVAATLPALCDIVRQVAGDDAHVKCLLPAGASPHYFEFTPASLAALQGTRIIFALGHGVDDWTQTATDAIENETLVIVDENIRLIKNDPHYWLSPINARIIADTVKRLLTNIDPANTLDYMQRTKDFQSRLFAKEKEWAGVLEKISSRSIFTLHDAWAYFADAFNLNIVGSYESAAGEEPTARDLAAMRATLRRHNVKVIFAEPQSSSEKMRTFADDLGIGIAELDPIEGTGGSADYIVIMDKNIRAIVDAFSSYEKPTTGN